MVVRKECRRRQPRPLRALELSGAVLVSGAIGPKAALLARLLAIAVALSLLSMAKAPGLFQFRGWLQRCCFALVVAWVVVVAAEFGLAS